MRYLLWLLPLVLIGCVSANVSTSGGGEQSQKASQETTQKTSSSGSSSISIEQSSLNITHPDGTETQWIIGGGKATNESMQKQLSDVSQELKQWQEIYNKSQAESKASLNVIFYMVGALGIIYLLFQIYKFFKFR